MAALTKKAVEGPWNIHEIRQYQSEASRANGEHPDGEGREDPRRSDLAGAVLDAAADGRWALRTDGETRAQGTWELRKGKLEFAEDPDFSSGYSRLVAARADKRSLSIAFELIPDAHDGLDVLELTFGREPLPEQLDAHNALRMIAAGLSSDQHEQLSRLEDQQLVELMTAAWDAWLAGTFASDESTPTYRDQVELLDSRTTPEMVARGVFRHAHALHALRSLDENGRRLLGAVVRRGIVALPSVPDADLEIARAITHEWLKAFAYDRSYGGSAPETLWRSPRFPTPAFDDECRSRFLEPGFAFGNRNVLGTLFAKLAERARAAVHLKSIVWSDIEDALRAHPEIARDEAHAFLAMTEEKRRAVQGTSTAWSNAQFFAVVCREDPGTLPPAVVEALGNRVTTREGSFDDAAKAYARTSIASLPEVLRTSAAQALWL